MMCHLSLSSEVIADLFPEISDIPDAVSETAKWTLAPKREVVTLDDVYQPFATSGNRVCYYYHVVFQLNNRCLRDMLKLELSKVKSLRYKIYHCPKWRILMRNKYRHLRNCEAAMQQAGLDTRHACHVITEMRKTNILRGTRLSDYVESFYDLVLQLLKVRPDLADAIMDLIVMKSTSARRLAEREAELGLTRWQKRAFNGQFCK